MILAFPLGETQTIIYGLKLEGQAKTPQSTTKRPNFTNYYPNFGLLEN